MKLRITHFLALLALSLRLGSAEEVSAPGPHSGSALATDNPELARLYHDDQSDRQPLSGKAIDWTVVGPRDKARRARVMDLYRSNQLITGNDLYHAAMVLQHGDAPEDFLLCHELCVAAIIKGNKAARWLAAASEDRFLMNINRPQRFGTQFRSLGDAPMALYETDQGVTDALRTDFDVPKLAEAKERSAQINQAWKTQNRSPDPAPSPVATPGQSAHQP